MEFGTNLKKVITDLGITQRELAEKMGKEETYISRVINNKYNASWGTIIQFAEALKVNPIVFFDDSGEEMVRVMLDELPEETKEFIRNKQNQTWLYLAKDLSDSDLSPETIRRVVELWKKTVEEGNK